MDFIREIRFFETKSGNVPFFDWYNSIRDKKIRLTVASKLRQIQNKDFKNYKSLSNGVLELRIFLGAGYRIYFGFKNNDVIVILTGGDKKSQFADVRKAIKFWEEFKNENKKL